MLDGRIIRCIDILEPLFGEEENFAGYEGYLQAAMARFSVEECPRGVF